MPYDPNLPQEHTLIDAAQMRGQLTGLKDLIDALSSITAAQVDGVTTLNPGDPASVTLSVSGSTLHFSFGIPSGQEGQAGPTGGVGPTGPPFAGVVVDGVLNLSPGDLPTVVATFDGTNVHFLFGLPRGFDGNTGGTGAQGQPGEVSNAQLSTAIAGTSSNTNSVSTLDTPFANDPPSLADLELMRAKMNELIAALRR